MRALLVLLVACATPPTPRAGPRGGAPTTATAATTPTPSVPAVEDCWSGEDDDGDGLVDCADPDCDGTCAETDAAACADGRDQDGDGLVDCADPGCAAFCTEDCTNGTDDDGDGLADCDDPACRHTCDGDGDGWPDDEDCAPTDPHVHPLAHEVCNGRDDDCDRLIDDDDPDVIAPVQGFVDADRDGWGDAGRPVTSCDPIPYGLAPPGDCDDARPDIHPDMPETCNHVDDDCDGALDADDPDAVLTDLFYDGDADGVGAGDPVPACWATPWWVPLGDDCAPDDPTIGGPVPRWRDVDGDGYGAGDGALHCPFDGWVDTDGDCDDADPLVNPAQPEWCNAIDDDCDGRVDDADADDLAEGDVFTPDDDRDGWGDPLGEPIVRCAKPYAYGPPADCNDDRDDVHPEAPEVCDGRDNDCDGLRDDADPDIAGQVDWYPDADGDRVGALPVTWACLRPPLHVRTPGDCDDADPHVGAGIPLVLDGDGDGVGAGEPVGVDCGEPRDGGLVHLSEPEDCDDAEPARFPGNPEVCDGLDNDCDERVDEGHARDWYYLDADGDGWSAHEGAIYACGAPDGYASPGDCDDADPHVHPDAPEVCFDAVDDDCDEDTTCPAEDHVPVVQLGGPAPSFAWDSDGDGAAETWLRDGGWIAVHDTWVDGADPIDGAAARWEATVFALTATVPLDGRDALLARRMDQDGLDVYAARPGEAFVPDAHWTPPPGTYVVSWAGSPDADGDGHADVLVAVADGPAALLTDPLAGGALGDGVPIPPPVGAGLRGLHPVDLDGDGVDGLAAVADGFATLWLLEDLAAGGAVLAELDGRSLSVRDDADVDGDGAPELLVLDADGLHVVSGRVEGLDDVDHVHTASVGLGDRTAGLARLADLDGDGVHDLVLESTRAWGDDRLEWVFGPLVGHVDHADGVGGLSYPYDNDDTAELVDLAGGPEPDVLDGTTLLVDLPTLFAD